MICRERKNEVILGIISENIYKFENLDDEYEITQIEDEHTFDEESEYEY